MDQEHDIFGSGDVNVIKIIPLPSDGDKERLKVSIEIFIVNPDPLSLSDAESSAKLRGIFSALFAKSFSKNPGLTDESKCDNSALYPLALMSASFTGSDDELSQNSEKSGDDMLDRLLQWATCTPPRKLKAEGVSTPSPAFDPLD